MFCFRWKAHMLAIIRYNNIIVSMIILGDYVFKYWGTRNECCQYLLKYKFYFYINVYLEFILSFILFSIVARGILNVYY